MFTHIILMLRKNFVRRQIVVAFIFGITALIAVGCLGSDLKGDRIAGEDWKRDLEANEYFLARGIACPLDNREKIFLPEVKKANFTFFKGMSEISVEDGKLIFTLNGTEAVLGWGNFMGAQPVAEIQNMGQQQVIIKIRVKQSAGTSTWTARLWRDGQRLDRSVESALAAPNMEEMEFKPLRSGGANPDGLELTINAEKGTGFEIEWLKFIQPTFEGYVRSEFVVPPGKIWRAIANVGSANERHWMGTDEIISRLYINGKVVERRGALHLYHTEPVDLTPYLRPGRNCVGFYGFRIGYSPFLFFQGKVIMESGELIPIVSSTDWKYSPNKFPGWNEPNFDDSTWEKAKRNAKPWITFRDAAWNLGIPAYSGRLVIKNPHRKDLFYTDTADVVVDVHIPYGLKDRDPKLSYILSPVNEKGLNTSTKENTVALFSKNQSSLVYRLNLGRYKRGVYTLALCLKSTEGAVIDKRSREPLVVLGRLALKTVEGTDYTDGLDLELEDTIDFTNPKDPHPCFESRRSAKRYNMVAEKVEQPVVVRKDDLVYREVSDPRRGSGFSYRIEFIHPGEFYYMELEYPDDAKRTIEVQVSSKIQGVWTNSQAGVGAETGGRFFADQQNAEASMDSRCRCRAPLYRHNKPP